MAAVVSLAPAPIVSGEGNVTDELVAKRQPQLERRELPLMPERTFAPFDLRLHVPTQPAMRPESLDAQQGTVSTAGPSKAALDSTEGQQRAAPPLPIRLPAPAPLTYTFELRQQWEGVVTNIARDEFTVVLRDLANRNAPEIEAVLPLEEVPDDDLKLLKRGAVLYWTIGYEQTQAGQRKRVSTIRLRRLPAWSRADVARIAKRAKELNELFSDE